MAPKKDAKAPAKKAEPAKAAAPAPAPEPDVVAAPPPLDLSTVKVTMFFLPYPTSSSLCPASSRYPIGYFVGLQNKNVDYAILS